MESTATDIVHETTVITVPAELEAKANETGLSLDGVQSLKQGFAPHFIAYHRLAEEARTVTAGQPKAARAVRLELRAVRIAAEKVRKELKEDSLRRGKAIDGINALLEYQLAPVEKAMQAIEDAEEIEAANRLKALIQDRRDRLTPYVTDVSFFELGGMPAAQFDQLLAASKAQCEAKAAADAKAEADRIAAEKAAAELKAKQEAEAAAERERMRSENERLAKVAAEERAAREKVEAEAKAAREAQEAATRKEREQAEARERERAATAKKEADRQAAELEKERQKRLKMEADFKAVEKATADLIAAEILLAAERARVAAAAPDKAKIKAMAEAVRSIPLPHLTTSKELADEIAEQVRKFSAWLEKKAAAL